MGLLPPVIAELRANAEQLYVTTQKLVPAAMNEMAVKTEASQTKMQAAFTKTAVAGGKIALGTAAAGIVVAAVSTKMAADFQSKMTLLVTAAGESQSNIKKVSDGVLSLAASTGTSIDQLSDGMYTVEKSGNRGAAGLNILKAAAQGAKAENVDLSIATNALTSVMMSYHLTSKDAISTQNMLIAGSGLAKTSMQEYASSLATVLPVASSAGISFAQVGGAIATLTQHGTSAAEATQELANTIRNLQAPNSVASQAMQQLGLDSVDVAKNLGARGLTGTIDLVTKSIADKMGPAGLVMVDSFKKSQAANQDLQTMLAKMPKGLSDLSRQYMEGKIGMKEYQTAFKDLGGAGTAMGTQFLSLSKSTQGFNNMVKQGNPDAVTFAGYLNKVMGGANGLNTALQVGGKNTEYFNKAVKEIGESGKKTGSNISTWAQTQSNLKVQVAQAGESIAAMGVKIGTVLIPFVSQALKNIGEFVTLLQKNPPLLITIASIIGGVMLVAITAWIAKLVIAAATTIYNTAQTAASIAVWIGQKAAIVGSTVALAAQTVASKVGAAATTVITGAQKAFTVVQWLAKASTLEYIGAMIAQKAVMVAGAVATGAMTAAQWLLNAAMDANPVGLIILAIAALIAIIILVITHWKEVSEFLMGVWQHVADFFVTVGTAWNKWWSGFWNGIVNLAVDLFLSYSKFMQDILNSVVGFFMAMGKGLGDWWSGFWKGLVSIAQTIFKGAFNFIADIINGVIDAVNTLTGAINSVGGAVGIKLSIGKIPHLPHFDIGGTVPGANGAPLPAIVHGGEEVLSNDMLAGRQPIRPEVVAAVQRNATQSSGGQPSNGGGSSYDVDVNVTTNASPQKIAASVGWELRRRG